MLQGKYDDSLKMYTAHISYARELHDTTAEAAALGKYWSEKCTYANRDFSAQRVTLRTWKILRQR